MPESPLPELDPLLHSALRLSVISVLAGVREADFNYLKERTNASNGNLSVQLSKLSAAGYIEIRKSFENNYPKTTCKITRDGHKALEKYVQDLKVILNQKIV
jgi:DNA-binding HxlR family transcriptional regulator